MKKKLLILFLLLIFNEVTTELPSLQSIKDNGCDYSIALQDFNASIIFSGLFPVQKAHIKTGKTKYKFYPLAISWVESFLYSINIINKNHSILPNIRLGYNVRNTCDNEQVAIRHTLDLMLDHAYMPVDVSTKERAINQPSPNYQCTCPNGISSKMVAVVGKFSAIVILYSSRILPLTT